MYRETLHTTRHLQARRLTEAAPAPRRHSERKPRALVGRFLVRVGERVLAGGIQAPMGSEV